MNYLQSYKITKTNYAPKSNGKIFVRGKKLFSRKNYF